MNPTTQDIIKKLQKKTFITYMQEHNIKHIWLAGSFSRGEQTKDSDIDIVYEEFDSTNPDMRLLSLPYMLQHHYLGKPVDLLYKYGINRHVRKDILSSMIPVW